MAKLAKYSVLLSLVNYSNTASATPPQEAVERALLSGRIEDDDGKRAVQIDHHATIGRWERSMRREGTKLLEHGNERVEVPGALIGLYGEVGDPAGRS